MFSQWLSVEWNACWFEFRMVRGQIEFLKEKQNSHNFDLLNFFIAVAEHKNITIEKRRIRQKKREK